MTLVKDAIATIKPVCFSKGRVNANVLEEILLSEDLDNIDILSIIFLMTDSNTNILEILEDIKNDLHGRFKKLSHQCNWAEKLLEVLIITKNYNILRRLDYNKNETLEMERRFSSNVHSVSENLNHAIKSLYFLCDHLGKAEKKKLIIEVNKKLNHPTKFDDSTILEVYILHWIQQKFITINQDKLNLSELVKCLKTSGCLSQFPDFDFWSQNPNQQDSSGVSEYNSPSQLSNINEIHNEIEASWEEEHKRHCIIINQINFTDTRKYEKRIGSEIDAQNLKESFQKCGFTVEDHKDFSQKQMIDLLSSLNQNIEYRQYGSIFMCILSHGYEGEIIFSDDKSISTKDIRKMFCCSNLQNTFKFVILQSCQGKKLGVIKTEKKDKEKLTADSPTVVVNDPTCYTWYKHYALFQATIDEFVAIRHTDKGSWFIEDICSIMKHLEEPIDMATFIQKVNIRLSKRRGEYNRQTVGQLAQVKDQIWLRSYKLFPVRQKKKTTCMNQKLI